MIDMNIVENINIGDKAIKPIKLVNIIATLIIITPAVGFQMNANPATIIINIAINNPVVPNISLTVVITKLSKSVIDSSKYP